MAAAKRAIYTGETLVLNIYFERRTTKSGLGGANPAVTAYSASPNAASPVGTFVAGLEVNGSVMYRVITPDR